MWTNQEGPVETLPKPNIHILICNAHLGINNSEWKHQILELKSKYCKKKTTNQNKAKKHLYLRLPVMEKLVYRLKQKYYNGSRLQE